MIPPADNPYTSPEVDPTPAGNALWRVRSRALLVRDGAELPEIDLYEGSEGPLVRLHRKIPLPHPLMAALPTIVALVGVYGTRVLPNGSLPYWPFLALAFLLARCGSFFGRKITLGYSLEVHELARRRRRRFTGWILGAGGLLLMAWPAIQGGSDFFWIPASGGALLLIGGLFLTSLRPAYHLSCVKSADGWHELAGVPRAVAMRAKRVSTSDEAGTP